MSNLRGSMAGDWSLLGYELARHGIPSDVEECWTETYADDPWRPKPGSEAIMVTLTTEDASRLVTVLDAAHNHTNRKDEAP